jgi:hypothetical protein
MKDHMAKLRSMRKGKGRVTGGNVSDDIKMVSIVRSIPSSKRSRMLYIQNQLERCIKV